jgi:hypothetical protein
VTDQIFGPALLRRDVQFRPVQSPALVRFLQIAPQSFRHLPPHTGRKAHVENARLSRPQRVEETIPVLDYRYRLQVAPSGQPTGHLVETGSPPRVTGGPAEHLRHRLLRRQRDRSQAATIAADRRRGLPLDIRR